jgi:17beta-estradiol 17-dehydrogenase / very-long-chain 3-oxoacyl-CoA reductase
MDQLTEPATLKAAGALILIYKVALPLLSGIYAHFLRPGKKLRKYGKWAVVTGATDGIGRALCVEFAKQGLDVVLISRTQSKLDEAANELSEKYNVETKTVSVDFGGGFDAAKQSKVAKALKGLDIGILANNVGMSYPFTKYYHELTDDECADLVSLNTESTLFMTKIVLGDEAQGMISRKRGAIVNTSSAAGVQPSPLLAGYAAAKGGIVQFTKSLACELKGLGIDVQVQTPLWVTTKLAKIRKTSLTVPSPSTYARQAIKFVGYDVACSPYWAHALQLSVADLLPSFILEAAVFSMHRAIRKKGLKKEAAKAKGQ